MNMNIRLNGQKTLRFLFLLIGVSMILFPLAVTLFTAMKTPEESAESFFSLPGSFYLGNFTEVIQKSNYWTYVMNSVIITGVSVLIILIIVPLVSYSISRNIHKRFYRWLYVAIIGGMFVPFQVIMLPLVKQMSALHLMNQTGIIILYVTFAFIQGVFLCVGYLNSIPLEIEEAGVMDGCSIWQIFFRIVWPLLKPITFTIVIIKALWIWNDFLLPLIILNKSSEYWTLQLFQYNFKSQYSFDYNLAFASYVLSMLPIMIMYMFTQRYIVSGLTDGAIKS
ncbi:carbohydrate ABC transporter permease [Marinicrinis sediminis]|uniref:Carbohydrate ABC transporter permease n=1 Tax=Marinicrinis sediminis TaxID=1652465 RepID=A0ABW5RC57_9BACL